ncbi:MAG: RapZ C-terminal domain-containing protein [Candidatus Helarchaeota archaeon]
MKTKIKLITCGFKYGRPRCNHFIDVSWIPNPWRHPDKNPKEIVFNTKGVNEMIDCIVNYIKCVADKDKMVFGICCSSGRDRSPLIAKKIKELLSPEIEVELIEND